MNAETAGHAGMPQLKQFHMVNIKIEFPRGISDQVISETTATANGERAPGPGLKQQAPSVKLQAPSSWKREQQASSVKHKGSSAKPQASSSWIIDPGKSFTDL